MVKGGCVTFFPNVFLTNNPSNCHGAEDWCCLLSILAWERAHSVSRRNEMYIVWSVDLNFCTTMDDEYANL